MARLEVGILGAVRRGLMPRSAPRRRVSKNEARAPGLLRLARNDGGAAIEFALVAPIFLLMLLGILVYGLYFGLSHSIEQLAAQAARVSVAGLDDTERESLAEDYLADNVRYYPLVEADRLSISAAPAAGEPDVFVVTLNYNLTGSVLDLFPAFLPNPEIAASAAIQRGGY